MSEHTDIEFDVLGVRLENRKYSTLCMFFKQV